MKSLVLLLLTLCMGLTATAQTQALNPAYTKKLNQLYRKSVPVISPAALAERLANGPAPVLLDTRSPAEYHVSHLPGAIFADYDRFDEQSAAHLDRKAPIIVYCTVGYRSERIGERLKKMGFTDVHNLYGGIFEWVNTGHSVVGSDNQPTTRVHTYNADWGKWLDKGEKVAR
jgi:rhodanese-related sulfurtransferase